MNKEQWKKAILEENDPKVLSYIRELCYARESLGRAEETLKKKKKSSDSDLVPAPYPDEPTKYVPVMKALTAEEEAAEDEEIL